MKVSEPNKVRLNLSLIKQRYDELNRSATTSFFPVHLVSEPPRTLAMDPSSDQAKISSTGPNFVQIEGHFSHDSAPKYQDTDEIQQRPKTSWLLPMNIRKPPAELNSAVVSQGRRNCDRRAVLGFSEIYFLFVLLHLFW